MKTILAFLLVLSPFFADAEVIEIDSIDHYRHVLEENKPAIVMIGADWCPYCKEAYPDFVATEKLYKGKVLFLYIDIDKNPIPGVPGLPYYIIADKKEIFNKESGDQNEGRDPKSLIKYIKKYTGVSP